MIMSGLVARLCLRDKSERYVALGGTPQNTKTKYTLVEVETVYTMLRTNQRAIRGPKQEAL